jgi:hypothetical protein
LKSYRIYIIGRDGRLELGQALQAQDDAAASAVAKAAAAPGQSLELWEGGRLVGRVSEDGVFSLGDS